MKKERIIPILLAALAIVFALSACHKAAVDDVGENTAPGSDAVTEPAANAGKEQGNSQNAVTPEGNNSEAAQEPAKQDEKTPEQQGNTAQQPESGTLAEPGTHANTETGTGSGTGGSTGAAGTETPGNNGETTPQTDPEEENKKDLERIEELKNSAFDLRAEYKGKLSDLESSAIDEYLALPQEQRTEEKKKEIALKYYDLATGLEGECDSKIDSICAELQYLLQKTGSSEALAREIRSEYNSEKESMRSKYMSAYGGYIG